MYMSVFIFSYTLTLDSWAFHQDQDFKYDQNEAQSAQLHGSSQEGPEARPQREKQSMTTTMEKLLEMISVPCNRG
jgi:hypothetical protein